MKKAWFLQWFNMPTIDVLHIHSCAFPGVKLQLCLKFPRLECQTWKFQGCFQKSMSSTSSAWIYSGIAQSYYWSSYLSICILVSWLEITVISNLQTLPDLIYIHSFTYTNSVVLNHNIVHKYSSRKSASNKC